MRKYILGALGIVLIVGSFLFAKRLIANKTRPRPIAEKVVKTVFTDTVENQTIQIVIPANGSLVAKRRVELFSEVQGIFRPGNKLFRAGQKYGRGQTIIAIDASEFYASVQSAKSNLYNSIAAILPDLRLDFPDVFQKWETYLNNFDLSKTTPELPKTDTEQEQLLR